MARRPSEWIGQELNIVIDALGSLGDGIARLGPGAGGTPMTLFVPEAAPGDSLRVRVTGQRGAGMLEGAILQKHAAGPDRRPPPCPHFGPCGGCQAQHLSPTGYATWKHGIVLDALARHGLPADTMSQWVRPPAPSRRRAQLSLRRLRQGPVIGFHARKSAQIIDIDGCLVLRPSLQALIAELRQEAWPGLTDGPGWRLHMTEADTGLDLIIEADISPALADRMHYAQLAERLDLARLAWVVRDGASAPGQADPIAIRRPPSLIYGGHAVALPPRGFLQATVEGEAAIAKVIETAIGKSSSHADLFCGIGALALPLWRPDRCVVAVEGDAAAAAALRATAQAAGLSRFEVCHRDLARDPLSPKELGAFSSLTLDPPRIGARPQAEMLARSSVACVVSVSCHPGSFARDARILIDGGYRLENLVPIDQFLWSPHIELVGVFTKTPMRQKTKGKSNRSRFARPSAP